MEEEQARRLGAGFARFCFRNPFSREPRKNMRVEREAALLPGPGPLACLIIPASEGVAFMVRSKVELLPQCAHLYVQCDGVSCKQD